MSDTNSPEAIWRARHETAIAREASSDKQRIDTSSGKPNAWQEFRDDVTGKVFTKAVYDPARDPNYAPPQSNPVGRIINGRRRQLKMTQADLASAMGVTRGLVSQWETGSSRVDANDLFRLAQALHTTPSELFSETHSMANAIMCPQDWTADQAAALSQEEQALISAFRVLNEERQLLVLRLVDAIRS